MALGYLPIAEATRDRLHLAAIRHRAIGSLPRRKESVCAATIATIAGLLGVLIIVRPGAPGVSARYDLSDHFGAELGDRH